MDLAAFLDRYGDDPFYSWFGLNSPSIYTAHKAAGGITSIYRQLGIGCERLFRTVIRDQFGLTEGQASWEYDVPREGGGVRKLRLDGRVDIAHIEDEACKDRVSDWLWRFKQSLDVHIEITGAVFEVRQGYKSKDSKRQNADLANAANAYTQRYLPVLMIMSEQLDTDLMIRYQGAKWGVLTGTLGTEDSCSSTYAFCRDVLAYDLAGFFERNSATLADEIKRAIDYLLDAT